MRKRYFNETKDFKPGVISEPLQIALGLSKDAVPLWIHRMRVLGYPPGWLRKADMTNTTIKVFDGTETNSVQSSSSSTENQSATPVTTYNPDSFIAYPGFNVPLPNGVVDDYEQRGMPPMLDFQQLKFAKKTVTAVKPVPYKRIKLSEDISKEKIVPIKTEASKSESVVSTTESKEQKGSKNQEESKGVKNVKKKITPNKQAAKNPSNSSKSNVVTKVADQVADKPVDVKPTTKLSASEQKPPKQNSVKQDEANGAKQTNSTVSKPVNEKKAIVTNATKPNSNAKKKVASSNVSSNASSKPPPTNDKKPESVKTKTPVQQKKSKSKVNTTSKPLVQSTPLTKTDKNKESETSKATHQPTASPPQALDSATTNLDDSYEPPPPEISYVDLPLPINKKDQPLPSSSSSKTEDPSVVILDETIDLTEESQSNENNNNNHVNSKTDQSIISIDGDQVHSKSTVNSPSKITLISAAAPLPIPTNHNKPDLRKFAEGMHDLVYFENLPDSTGTFDRMRTTIKKIRKSIG